jgi:hypothetical protein
MKLHNPTIKELFLRSTFLADVGNMTEPSGTTTSTVRHAVACSRLRERPYCDHHYEECSIYGADRNAFANDYIGGDFINAVLGVVRGLIPAMALLRSLVYLFASSTVTAFFWVFRRGQS